MRLMLFSSTDRDVQSCLGVHPWQQLKRLWQFEVLLMMPIRAIWLWLCKHANKRHKMQMQLVSGFVYFLPCDQHCHGILVLMLQEVHYNQHGLLLLQGQGIYRLADKW